MSRSPTVAADPVITTRTIVKTVCPAEVTAPLPAPVPAYDGPAIEVPPAFLDWQSAHLRREHLLVLRIGDAAAACR